MSLQIALPSKGRLREHTLAMFEKIGWRLSTSDNARTYKTKIEGVENVEVHFLSALEIAREIAFGSIHMGVTGLDLIYENGAEDMEKDSVPLGFGNADVVVAVPDAWVDVQTMADLDDVAASYRMRYGRRLRVATKYRGLTQNYFQKHAIAIYRLMQSSGATEGAPASGHADVIVDITSSGKTLEDNKLKVLEDGLILKSQACLVKSPNAKFNSEQKKLADEIKNKISKR